MHKYYMSYRMPAVALAASVGIIGMTAPARADPVVQLPWDKDTKVEGVDVACTGIGQTRNDAHWRDYPVKLEFSDAKGGYVADETLKVYRPGRLAPLKVSCDAPWVLMKLPPGGRYHIQARLDEPGTTMRSAAVTAPEHGQARVLITFPHSG